MKLTFLTKVPAAVKNVLVQRIMKRIKTPKLVTLMAKSDPAEYQQIIRNEAVNLVKTIFVKYFIVMNLCFGIAGAVIGFIAGTFIA